jgi:hypothetical protein
MTFAGNKLQDIYDSGCQMLADAELAVTERLKDKKQVHTTQFKSGVEVSAEKVRKTSRELQSELSDQVQSSLAHLQNTARLEIEESRNHSQQLVSDLGSLSEKLKASISALKLAYQERIDQISESFSDRYTTSVEHSKLELERQDFASIKHLKSHGTFVSNQLQQKLDHVLWESRGEEKQVTGTLFKSYMQKANAIDSHFSNLMQKLSGDFQQLYKMLEAEALRSEAELESASKTLLSRIDNHSSSIEKSISENFRITSDSHRKKLDLDLASVADDLSGVHDATTERLSQTTEELVSGLSKTAEQSQASLKSRCQDVRAKIEGQLDNFNERLEERIRRGTSLKRTLEGDKDVILRALQAEITEIKESFEKRVASLMQEGAARVSTISADAEKEIVAAQAQCEQNLKINADEARKEIDDQVNGFLTVIAQHRANALSEIGGTVEEHGSGSSAGISPKQKRSKKSKIENESDQ